jgi:hypothetical protein
MTKTYGEGLLLSDFSPVENYMEVLRLARWLKKLCKMP